MPSGNVTTPFGRRPAKLALVAAQREPRAWPAVPEVGKWKVYRDVCEARDILGISASALAVLNALLSFYPDDGLSRDSQPIVFPSNAQLSLRAHGVSGRSLRRHIASLVDAGIVERHDSPNGKRYVHRGREGEVEQAYGFSLIPLLLRAGEFAGLAQRVVEERRAWKRLKDDLTTCRRDVRKLIAAAIEDGIDADWAPFERTYQGLVEQTPRVRTILQIENALEDMRLLLQEVLNMLEMCEKAGNASGNAGQNDRHLQNSKPESIREFEPRFEKMPAAGAGCAQTVRPVLRALPLPLVLRACPQIADYGPGGAVASWRELMAAGVTVRSFLGVSPSAYEDACAALGPENAAVVMGCILERVGHISSPGGYLRDLTAKARRGTFSIGPMVMALMKAGSDANQPAM